MDPADDGWSAFRASAIRHPQRPALLCGEHSCTFAELAGAVARYRHAYRRAGLARGDRVLLWMANSPGIAAALVAAWGEGAVPALLDAGSRAPQLQAAIDCIAPRLLVRHAEATLPLPDIRATQVVVEDLDVAPDTPRPSLSEGAAPLPTDPASIVFTSGSTGRPKAVVQAHGHLVRGCRTVGAYLGLRDDDRLLCPVPWAFDYGFGQLLSTLVLGVTQVIPEAFTPFGTCAALERHRPTVLAGLPALYTYLVSGLSPIRSTDRRSVRLLTNTGGAIPPPALRELREMFADADLALNYGLTETYRSCRVPPGQFAARHDSLGIPIPGVDIAIVREDGSLAGPSEEGEIVHRGDYICLGYWGDAESTARVVRPDPLAVPGSPHAGRALYTGDFGHRDADGYVYFRGRRDHLLKSMGVRVSPAEIERLLYESGLVLEAAVFGLPHPMLGDEVCAAIVWREAANDAQRRLESYARDSMTQPMLPRRYLSLDRLPRTTTGKVDYPALRADAAALAHATPR